MEPNPLNPTGDVQSGIRRIPEEFLATAFRSNPAGIGITTLATGRVLDVNERLSQFFGWPRADIIGKTVFEIGVWADPAQREPLMGELRASGSVRDREILLRRRDGEVRTVLVSSERLELPGEPEPVVVSTFTDHTDRKLAEEALKESEGKFVELFESSPDGIIVATHEGVIRAVNRQAERQFGYSREELIGRQIEALMPARSRPGHVAHRERYASMPLIRPMGEGRNLFALRKDGSEFPVDISLSPMTGGREPMVMSTVRDITERKKLEQQFLRSQRMESIGTLAGGIAHDLNNVLQPIVSSIELLSAKCTDPESQELLSILSSSAHRGAGLVRQVLSFARGVEGSRVDVHIEHLIREIERMAGETFPKQIHIRTAVSENLRMVLGDPTQLHQMLLNLCVNARDAMPHGGTLTLSAENVDVGGPNAGPNTEAKPGPYVLIQVEDSGTGIPAEDVEKIFDPFFTTKEPGKGTGLGLSTSLSIIKSHGGFIRVRSAVGNGTTFKVFLPGHTGQAAASAAPEKAKLPRGNGELILLVDDEEAVRQITRRTLEVFGYRVITASDGSEAAAIYAEQGSEIAAVLTDMMMPVLDGVAFIAVAQRMNPNVRIIAASGLSATGLVAQARELGVRHFLPKPYSAEELLKTLREVLTST